mgnify:CR=1 FL=1
MVMPFDTYGASRRAREMQDEVERRRRLQRDLGNPQADNANIYSTSFDPPPGAMNPFSNPNLSAPSAPPPATSPSDVVNRQMLFTPSQTFVSAEEEERNRQRLAQEEAVRLDATLRAQQQAAAATQSGGFGGMQFPTADRTGAPGLATPVLTPQQQLEQQQEVDNLKDGLARILFGDVQRFLSGAELPERNALLRIGIGPEQLNSNDPNVLRDTIEQIINSNVVGQPEFDTMSTRLAYLPFGQSPEQSRLQRNVDLNERLRKLLGGDASATDLSTPPTGTTPAATTTPATAAAPGTVTPGGVVGGTVQQGTVGQTPIGQVFNEAYDAIALLRSGATGTRLPSEIYTLAAQEAQSEARTGPATDLIDTFNAILADPNQRSFTPFTELELPAQLAAEEQRRQENFADAQRSATQTFETAQLGREQAFQQGEAQRERDFASQERIATQAFQAGESLAQRNLERELANSLNTTNTNIANINADATRFVAETNRISAEQVALINTRSAQEVARITGLNQANVESIKGQYAQIVARQTGQDKATVQRIIEAGALSRQREQVASNESISEKQLQNALTLQQLTGTNQLDIVNLQNQAAEKVANANNTNALEIVKLQGADAFALAQMQISNQFTNQAEIERLQNEYQKELATLTNTTEEQIARINTEANASIEAGRIAADKAAYESQQAFQSQEAQAQREFEAGQTAGEQAFQAQQAQLDRAAQAENVRTQFLNGLQPSEFAELQRDIARGGLTVEESENLAALVARGGLSAEERIAEMNAESRSDEMNAFISLLSNPSALGAFVTAISGELPFDAVPTLGQLSEMTPNRIQYLQGALSALGIDPQSFIRMAQSVTPQAFQETGPFGQITAMVA